MKHKLIYIITIFFIFISCVKQTPQLPANKMIKEDSTSINLQKMNVILAQKEDSIIQQLVDSQKIPYTKSPSGIWIHKEIVTSLDSLIKSSEINFEYKCYSLTGEAINSEKSRIHLGKKETIIGLEEGLKLMRKGEKIRLIVPWYLAYGMNGKDNIPPYTSLIYEIRAEN